jgi:hypothetical protein
MHSIAPSVPATSPFLYASPFRLFIGHAVSPQRPSGRERLEVTRRIHESVGFLPFNTAPRRAACVVDRQSSDASSRSRNTNHKE